MSQIRASTVLPARPLELHTADGLRLVGELALPLDRPPVATLVTLHPLPTAGGFMDSHVLRKASYRLPALADLAVLRFNTRGTSSPHGTSEGAFDEAVGERFDVAAAIEYAEFHEAPALPRRWLLGWSFGTDLALMYGLDPSVEGLILLSPPLRFRDSDREGAPDVVIVNQALVREYWPGQDPLGKRIFMEWNRDMQAEVVGVDGAKHLWVGEPSVRRALNEIVRCVVPDRFPLPEAF